MDKEAAKKLVFSQKRIPPPRTLLTIYDVENNPHWPQWIEYYRYSPPNDPPSTLKPSITHCSKCKAPTSDMLIDYVTGKYLDVHCSSIVEIGYIICDRCGTQLNIDGCNVHLFNYGNKIIVTHQLLIDMMLFICSGRSAKTFANFHSMLMQRYHIRSMECVEIERSDIISIFIGSFDLFEFGALGTLSFIEHFQINSTFR